jgi:hypothetical protein
MSALGHKPTYAVQKGTSALPPIATAKADSRKRSCPLYPPKADMCGATRDVRFGAKSGHCDLGNAYPDMRTLLGICVAAVIAAVVWSNLPTQAKQQAG